ncbi:Heat shock factor protein [Wickerhamomyces ciferrii]|uniref:Heat shock factor protein n=1 Tax=Wickerhamomyces ciferrii (strain ATCC 14091 / BCRC 22168 / CBS 111 / JCM 3599 / NBRC 0793 / NRRL Y-1031 F-60-10) TaxID=1206466 RepID=K0KLH7_WICCF|nr:Heat shock factor protein [Wickerhamomyces ciferrii]CCH43826.1 Heat shock factor protein [Wickerhamomyces ciferrii]
MSLGQPHSVVNPQNGELQSKIIEGSQVKDDSIESSQKEHQPVSNDQMDVDNKPELQSEKPKITPTSSSESTQTLDFKNKNARDVKKDVTILPTNTKGLHTVFIHKLYNMLEDDDLKHLIWWSSTNESFVIAPGEEFSKALAQYFKHTNVASFVRQLNMYGFHKVSDGSTSDTNDVTLWEFRHSSGSFRKGDIDSLKSIKRRSSKHTSKSITSNNEYSDNEGIQSERSNSLVDSQGETPVDPVLNVRLAELGHNLAALRHEHARLQLRYDTAIDDLRKTNLDMVYLLDLVQKLVRTSNEENQSKDTQTNSSQSTHNRLSSPVTHQIRKIDEDPLPSPGTAPNDHHSDQVDEIEHDIARFRASIIQRAASRDVDQYSVSFAPSYQLNPRTSQPHVQPPPPPPPRSSTPSGTQETYPYPYPQNQPGAAPQQHPGPPPFHQPPQQHLPPHLQQQNHHQLQVPGPQIVQDPFHADRKASNSSSSKSRNMSILYDPLAPAGPGGAAISPASQGSYNRSSVSGHLSNTDTNITSPTIAQNSYFPDYNTLQRSHSPHQVVRDQRAGSFPGIAPGIQNTMRADGLMRKRHSSNDATEFSRVQEFNFNNPPRSIPISRPEDTIHQNNEPRKSASATSLTSLRTNHSHENLKSLDNSGAPFNPNKPQQQLQQPYYPSPQLHQQQQQQQQQGTSGSGVYALLNPSDQGRPIPKKSRNA